MNLSIFLSGRGSNFEAIANAITQGKLSAKICLVASNNSEAPGLHKAGEMGLPTAVFDRKLYSDGNQFADYMLNVLHEHKTDYIALAGYLRLLPPRVVREFRKRIVNIHPALLPRHGGKNMFGMNVHRSVIASEDEKSGVTIHYVDEIYDHGSIIAQSVIPVLPEDTPESLASRVLEIEHQFYPEVLQRIAETFNNSEK